MENGLNALNRGYRRLLMVTLKLRPLVMLVALGVAGSSYFLFMQPQVRTGADRGSRRAVHQPALAPEGSTIDFTNRYSGQMQALLKQIPEVETYFVITGRAPVNELISFSRLKPWSERDRSQMEIAAELAAEARPDRRHSRVG